VPAEDADRRLAGVTRQRALGVGQEADEERLAGAVRAEDRGVLAIPDRQAEPIEDGAIVLDDGRVGKLENRHTGHVA
jgi:hypothetical protein